MINVLDVTSYLLQCLIVPPCPLYDELLALAHILVLFNIRYLLFLFSFFPQNMKKQRNIKIIKKRRGKMETLSIQIL